MDRKREGKAGCAREWGREREMGMFFAFVGKREREKERKYRGNTG